MKKILSLILTLCMCLTLGAALTACDFGTTDPGHTHTYETAWSHDDTNHWYACEDNTCEETSQKAEHSIENDVCSVCGYEQSNPTPPPTPSANEVTEEQFNAAISFVDITSVTVHSESNANIVNGVQQEVCYATMYLQDNKLKYVSGNLTAYNEVYDTFAYGYSYDTEQEKWLRIKIEDTDDDFSDLMTFATIKEMFEGIDFSDFVYADGSYTGSQIFEEGTDDEYTVNFRFQFEDGRLISARGEYEVEGFACYDSLTFSDYNTTTVSLPAVYEDYTEPTPNPDDSWASYFEFDNVTVSLSSSTYYPDYDMTITSSESMKVQGEEWLWETTDYFYNDNLYDEFAVYFDGTNTYVYGVVDNGMNTQNVVFFLNADFSAYESSFTETSSGVFEADEISAYGVYTYKDVQLVISNGKISSISYSIEFSSGGTSYDQTVEYTFSDWDETVIDGDKYTQPSAWGSYFDFENVTITEILQYVVEGTTHSMETNWNVDDGSWVCNKVMEKVDGIATIVNQAYYDGTNYYLNGNLISEDDIYIYHYLSGNLLGDLIGYESSFNKSINGSKTIYSADSIILYGALTYTDVELTVENGKIVKLTYKLGDAALHEGQYYDGTYTLTFSDYGTTIVEGSTEPAHTCSYVKEIISQEYLRTPATCENLATYYYSCECEKVGTEWFEYGSLADCTYGDWYSNNDGTHSRICSIDNTHIDTKDCYGGVATCENLAVCDGCDSEYGELGDHDCSLEIESDEHLISPCGDYAEYYKSCVCGLSGTETFFVDAWEICDYGFWVSNGDGTHTRTCSRNASHTEMKNCSGGGATCDTLAICDYCNCAYGEYATHSFEDGYCSDCGEIQTKGLLYELSSDETYYIVAGMGTCTDSDIVIPEIYNEKPVKEIKSNAFYNKDIIKSIYIPSNVEVIGNTAFQSCEGLTAVSFGKHSRLRTIGDKAFYYCTSLSSFEFPDTVENIGEYIFYTCYGLKSVTFGDMSQLTNISYYAFYKCTQLTDIEIPIGVTEIDTGAFSECSKLSAVTISEGVIKIEGGAFQKCTNLIEIELPASVKELGGRVFSGCTKLKSVVFDINGDLTTIGSYAFEECKSLMEITIPKNVTTLSYGAYYNCVAVERINYFATACNDITADKYIFYNVGQNGTGITVNIDDEVKTIPAYLFYPVYQSSDTSPRITVVNFEKNSICESIGEFAFAYCKEIIEINYNLVDCTDVGSVGSFDNAGKNGLTVNIGANVKIIPPRLFVGLPITKVHFAEDSICETIGGSAFSTCTQLTEIDLPNSIKVIGYQAFAFSGLTEIDIPEGVLELGEGAFRQCQSLTNVTLPNSVQKIGSSVFAYCNKLNYYKYENGNYLGNATNNYILLVEAEWTDDNYTYVHKIHEAARFIHSYAFSGCEQLRGVTIGPALEGIGDYAFYGCVNLSSITMPASLKYIGKLAFWNCDALNTVAFEETTGWWYADSPSATSGTEIQSYSLTSTLAYAAINSYFDKYWFRT